MNRFAFALVIFTTCILAFSTKAQTLKFRDVPNRSGVETAYDEFNDRTILSTKRELVAAIFEGMTRQSRSCHTRHVHDGQRLDNESRARDSPIFPCHTLATKMVARNLIYYCRVSTKGERP